MQPSCTMEGLFRQGVPHCSEAGTERCMRLQSLEDTLHIVREAMTREQAAVQQPLNLDNDASLDNFIEDQGTFDEDLPYLTEGNLLPFLSSLELQQHDF